MPPDSTAEPAPPPASPPPRAGARLQALAATIEAACAKGLPAEVQGDLATLLSLLPDLAREDDPDLAATAEVAVTALLSKTPERLLAGGVITGLRRRLALRRSRLRRLAATLLPCCLHPTSPPAPASLLVVLGLAAHVVTLPAILPYFDAVKSQFADTLRADLEAMALAALAGGLGSVVSILIRLRDFHAERNAPFLLFFSAFFKPVVGVSMALFAFAAVRAGLLPLKVPDDGSGPFLFFTLGFVMGFSERLARGVLSRAAGTLAAGAGLKAGTAVPDAAPSTPAPSAPARPVRPPYPGTRAP